MLGCLWMVAGSFEICIATRSLASLQFNCLWRGKNCLISGNLVTFSLTNQQNLNNEITNVLPIHRHLTITDFNALMFISYIDVFLSIFFMRSPDWFETLVSVRNLVQISFRFWAGEAIWETAVGTWAGLFNISYNPSRDQDKISAYRLSHLSRWWEDQTRVFWAQNSFWNVSVELRIDWESPKSRKCYFFQPHLGKKGEGWRLLLLYGFPAIRVTKHFIIV